MISRSLHLAATFHFIKQHTLPNILLQVYGVAWSCPLPAWFLVPNREAKTPPPRLFHAVATTHTRPRPNTTEVKWRRLHCCRNPYMPLQSYCLTRAPNRRPPPSQRLTQFHIHELQHKVSASDSPPISMHLGRCLSVDSSHCTTPRYCAPLVLLWLRFLHSDRPSCILTFPTFFELQVSGRIPISFSQTHWNS